VEELPPRAIVALPVVACLAVAGYLIAKPTDQATAVAYTANVARTPMDGTAAAIATHRVPANAEDEPADFARLNTAEHVATELTVAPPYALTNAVDAINDPSPLDTDPEPDTRSTLWSLARDLADTRPATRVQSVAALAQLARDAGDETGEIRGLLERSAQDQHPIVASAARSALHRIADPLRPPQTLSGQIIPGVNDSETLTSLGGKLTDGNPAVRRGAVIQLGTLARRYGDPTGEVATLLQSAAQDLEPSLAAQATVALHGLTATPTDQP
jgi:hypothetical protein